MKMVHYNRYRHGNTREICHEIKNRNEECYKIMADFFLAQEIVDKSCILIPAPQHEGYAVYTKQIAELIAQKSGAAVADVIKSTPRKTLYEYKQKCLKPMLNFTLMKANWPAARQDEDVKMFLIDNVLDTGQTLKACQRAVGVPLTPLVYGVVNGI